MYQAYLMWTSSSHCGDKYVFLFQDVFPGDFGPTYDKAIQTLMWLFLSRLEKLLPTQTLQQVDVNEKLGGNMLCVVNSVLYIPTLKTFCFTEDFVSFCAL